jgi:hypothetical protein
VSRSHRGAGPGPHGARRRRVTDSAAGDQSGDAGTSVASVTFGHTNPDPTAKEFTAIKALSYTPAQ